jgi:hypothetical protein
MQFQKIKYYTLIFLSVGLFALIPLTVNAVQPKSPTSVTWYVNLSSDAEKGTTLNNWAYDKGYEQGRKDLSSSNSAVSTVILDFGQPWNQGELQGTTGFYNYYVFLGTNDIYLAAQYFASGYYYGSNSGSKILRLAMGTNNQNAGNTVTYVHGQAWAQMVNSLNTWINSTVGKGKIFFYGASDIEPAYSAPSIATNWVNGYASVWVYPSYLLNYGSADGCPTYGTTSTATNCSSGWNQDYIYQVSWGTVPVYPFPEIYNTVGAQAKQWQQLSLYSFLIRGSRMSFVGPLSQNQACLQRGGCSGTNNIADTAWNQLWNNLNGDSRTLQDLSFSSDVAWRK